MLCAGPMLCVGTVLFTTQPHRCRPRESGDPYAVSPVWGTACKQLRRNGVWVPAFAGTTHSVLLCKLNSRRCSLRAQVGRVLHRLDDLHVAGTPTDVAAKRFADLGFARARVRAQQARRRHDEARRAIAALRPELLMKAALHGG